MPTLDFVVYKPCQRYRNGHARGILPGAAHRRNDGNPIVPNNITRGFARDVSEDDLVYFAKQDLRDVGLEMSKDYRIDKTSNSTIVTIDFKNDAALFVAKLMYT